MMIAALHFAYELEVSSQLDGSSEKWIKARVRAYTCLYLPNTQCFTWYYFVHDIPKIALMLGNVAYKQHLVEHDIPYNYFWTLFNIDRSYP